MKIRTILLVAGLTAYVCSFFLIAVKEYPANNGGLQLHGYECAMVTLTSTVGHDAMHSLRGEPLQFFSILISGWINLVFLLTLVFMIFRRLRPIAAILRIVVVLMVPFTWVVFHQVHFIPREGHFLWIAGMLLAMFSVRTRPAPRSSAVPPS